MRVDVEVTGLTLIKKGRDETSVVLATLQGVDTDFHCSMNLSLEQGRSLTIGYRFTMTDELPKVEA